MAAHFFDVMPLVCPLSGHRLPTAVKFSAIVAAVSSAPDVPEGDRQTMIKQLFYARNLVADTLSALRATRCDIGSCEGDFMWFPFALDRAVWTVPTLDRLILAFLQAQSGDLRKAGAIARDVLRPMYTNCHEA